MIDCSDSITKLAMQGVTFNGLLGRFKELQLVGEGVVGLLLWPPKSNYREYLLMSGNIASEEVKVFVF